jgi:hypothetical protein
MHGVLWDQMLLMVLWCLFWLISNLFLLLFRNLLLWSFFSFLKKLLHLVEGSSVDRGFFLLRLYPWLLLWLFWLSCLDKHIFKHAEAISKNILRLELNIHLVHLISVLIAIVLCLDQLKSLYL